MKKLQLILLLGLFCLNSNSQEIPATPTLSVSSIKGRADSVILKWKSIPGNMLGHVVERQVGNGAWLIIGQTDPSECNYADVFDPSKNTRYRVRAYGDTYYSPYSNELVCAANPTRDRP